MPRLSKAEWGLAIQSELVDRLTASTSRAFTEAEIPHLLLKGPSFAAWLYDADELRPYTDSDLLVPRWYWDQAVAVLTSSGFDESLGVLAHPRMESFTSHAWRGPEGEVDLHATLHGLRADWTTVWRVLSSDAQTLEVGGVDVPVLSESARLMHVAIHAGQHQSGWAVDDLTRALERFDDARWRHAAGVARRLGAEAAFASGLRILPAGTALASRLGVLDADSAEAHMRSAQVPLAEGLMALLRARGVRARAEILRHELAPTPAFMRWWSPLASRGAAGLALSYLWRPVYLVRLLPRAVQEVRRALSAEADQRPG